MTQRGPKPVPTKLRILSGGQEARSLHPREPDIPSLEHVPPAPAWMSDMAREEWDRVAGLLWGVAVLTEADLTMLAAYSQAYGHWRKAEADLRAAQRAARQDPNDKTSGGALMETTNGNLVQNPLIGIVNVARREMARLATEFGLTPSSRTLIESGKRGETDPVAAKYFGRG